MRRLLSVVAVAGLLLAACSDDDDGDAVTTTTVVEDDARGAGEDGDADDGDGGDDGPTTTNEATTTTAPADDETGGSDDPAAIVLEAAGLLRDGRATIGMTAPDDPGVQQALCRFVFGEPADVGRIAGHQGEAAIADGSGYEELGGNGGGLQCVYEFDGLEVVGLALWSEELEVGERDELVVQAPVDGQFGIVAYNPDHDGPRMDVETATALLEDASSRWNPAGT